MVWCVCSPESGFVRKTEERSRKHGLFWHYQFRSVFGIVGGVIGHCDMKGIPVIMSQCQIVVPLSWHVTGSADGPTHYLSHYWIQK